VAEFRQTILALTSLLTAVCLSEMASLDGFSDKLANVEILGWDDFDEETRLAVQNTDMKVELIYFWWQSYTSSAANEGILDVPPPIVSRVYAMIGRGLDSFEQAAQLTRIAMPVPYAQTTQWLLAIHCLITPLSVLVWTEEPMTAFLLTFILVFIAWALYFISIVLEHPFGDDDADIDVCRLQRHANASLLMLRSEEATHPPKFGEGFRQGKGIMESTPGNCIFGEDSDSDDGNSKALCLPA